MAEETPSLHIDNDWKKQAQEEKRRLAEEEQKKRAAAPAPAAIPAAGASVAERGRRAEPGRRDLSGMPEASFATLIQSLMTQVLFYLGDLAPRGAEPQLNPDLAKHNIDLLGMLEEKTRGNLTEDERHLLDVALYETRMRFVAVSSQLATV